MFMPSLSALPVAPRFLRAARLPIASCFGSGGAFGIGFCMGVVAGLRDGGIPVDGGPMLGTSAGAWTAAAVAADITYDDLLERSSSYQPGDGPMQVGELTRAVFGDLRDDRVSGMAIELPLGLRRALRGDRHDLADIVAASSSPPRLATPHRIGGHRYIDAGLIRSTSADRAEPARILVVVAPIGSGVMSPFGRAYENVSRFEIQQWKLKSGGGDVLFVGPNREVASLLPRRRLEAILDPEVGTRVYEPSYQLGRDSAEHFLVRHEPFAEECFATRSSSFAGSVLV